MTAARFTVDPWDPSYGAALDHETDGGLESTTAKLDLDVEIPASEWEPVTPAPGTPIPAVLLIADGVRRIDARVWTHPETDGAMPSPGIAASTAVGIVRCVPGGGTPATLAAVQVSRSVFSAAPRTPDIVTPAATYTSRRAAQPTMEHLSLALQQHLAEQEVDLAIRHRAEAGDDLLLVDGPLRGRTHLPRTVGYIKTHHTAYLPPPQAAVVSALRPAQRTPVFLMGTSWRRHTWYLRLPVRSTTPWAGIVRCEAGADLFPDEVKSLADAITLTLPPLAGVDYKDPRAPQNLVPIGGLEKLLRHRLGDPRLLYRSLRTAATRDVPVPATSPDRSNGGISSRATPLR
ncbi:hypothetical protein [Sphaerisporangium aureirubrum]|uniref:NurA domain-containing protein n=1 Tax=Sphaerisporangium aureirubrum TaxID=1544736 RepID=A0ABW1NP50_9ACTN